MSDTPFRRVLVKLSGEALERAKVDATILALKLQGAADSFADPGAAVPDDPRQVYDVRTAIETAVKVAGPELGGVRLDSGDLVVQAKEVREQLDALGATETKIVVTSDLDEGPIIEQDFRRVDHRMSPAQLAATGAELEAMAFARALRWHVERRVVLRGRRTIVFD